MIFHFFFPSIIRSNNVPSIFYSDAAGRNRLDATTFRLLNLGIILDAVQTVSSTLPITLAIARSSSYLKSLFGLLCLCHAYLTASTSYSALSSYGVPKIKFGIPGPLSAAYLVRRCVCFIMIKCDCINTLWANKLFSLMLRNTHEYE
jgi:hypothetical protein